MAKKYTNWNKFSKQAGFKILNYWFPIMEQFIKLPRPPLKIFSKEQVHLYYIKSQFICQFSLYTFGEGFQYWRIFSIKGVGVVGTSQIRQKFSAKNIFLMGNSFGKHFSSKWGVPFLAETILQTVFDLKESGDFCKFVNVLKEESEVNQQQGYNPESWLKYGG